jgi:acyl-coenzyme A synthetase/AMP-(fatty) acid ligase
MWLQGRQTRFSEVVTVWVDFNAATQACFQNPVNPVQNNVAILDQTNCVKAFYSAEFEDVLVQYRLLRPQLSAFELPSLLHFFETKTQPFPYHQKPWNEAKHEPILTLHSSGTTGKPKPITYRNGIVKCLDSPWPEDFGPMNLFSQLDGGFCYAPVPSFHSGGFLLRTLFPTLFPRCAMIMGPPTASSPSQNARLAIQIIRQRKVTMITAMPLLLEELARTAGGIEMLASLKFVTYGGAPLRKALGDRLCSKGVQPISIYGSTETAFLPTKSPKRREDWEYMQFPPDLKITWNEVDGAGNGTYELCFEKSADPAANDLRGTHWSLQVDEWRSKDLFTRHPTAPEWWKFVGRKDDILVLGDGNNINPTALEETLQSHPKVSGALMAGENKWPPCVLIELYDEIGEGGAEAFRAGLQSAIDEANRVMRADHRIPDDHVLVLGSGSFVRNLKGGVMRSKTVLKYKVEIDGLYAKQRST